MTLGRYSPERKRLELLPEEALYMFERGAIELWSEREEGGELVRVAMTVQQAWAALIGHDELTVERFQVSPNS
jgi:tRNA-splicing endonuclease subunit Sen54